MKGFYIGFTLMLIYSAYDIDRLCKKMEKKNTFIEVQNENKK